MFIKQMKNRRLLTTISYAFKDDVIYRFHHNKTEFIIDTK